MVEDRCKICYRYIGKEGIELKVDDKVLRFCCETCMKKFKDKAREDMKESCGL
jgi:ribosome-binding protein aMBF1 (putative translation factor)